MTNWYQSNRSPAMAESNSWIWRKVDSQVDSLPDTISDFRGSLMHNPSGVSSDPWSYGFPEPNPPPPYPPPPISPSSSYGADYGGYRDPPPPPSSPPSNYGGTPTRFPSVSSWNPWSYGDPPPNPFPAPESCSWDAPSAPLSMAADRTQRFIEESKFLRVEQQRREDLQQRQHEEFLKDMQALRATTNRTLEKISEMFLKMHPPDGRGESVESPDLETGKASEETPRTASLTMGWKSCSISIGSQVTGLGDMVQETREEAYESMAEDLEESPIITDEECKVFSESFLPSTHMVADESKSITVDMNKSVGNSIEDNIDFDSEFPNPSLSLIPTTTEICLSVNNVFEQAGNGNLVGKSDLAEMELLVDDTVISKNSVEMNAYNPFDEMPKRGINVMGHGSWIFDPGILESCIELSKAVKGDVDSVLMKGDSSREGPGGDNVVDKSQIGKVINSGVESLSVIAEFVDKQRLFDGNLVFDPGIDRFCIGIGESKCCLKSAWSALFPEFENVGHLFLEILGILCEDIDVSSFELNTANLDNELKHDSITMPYDKGKELELFACCWNDMIFVYDPGISKWVFGCFLYEHIRPTEDSSAKSKNFWCLAKLGCDGAGFSPGLEGVIGSNLVSIPIPLRLIRVRLQAVVIIARSFLFRWVVSFYIQRKDLVVQVGSAVWKLHCSALSLVILP